MVWQETGTQLQAEPGSAPFRAGRRRPREVPTSETIFLRSTKLRAELDDPEALTRQCWPSMKLLSRLLELA